MKILTCPLNGPRNISEFVYGGEVREMPDPQNCSDREWAEYVFYHDNAIGIVREWWLHAASGYWFIAERHTASDEVLRSYDPSEIYQARVEFSHASEKTDEASLIRATSKRAETGAKTS